MLNPMQILTFAPCQDDIGAVKVYVRFTPESGHKGTHGDGSVALIPAVQYTGGVAGVSAGLMPCLTS
jgi:hypothetical protein